LLNDNLVNATEKEATVLIIWPIPSLQISV